MRSALYRGSVMHRRLQPRRHHFRYRVFWLLIDLDELPMLSQRLRLFSHNRANLFSLHDRDHADGSDTPLRLQAERLLADAGIDLGGGRMAVLCMPRTLGYDFNPLSIYFCRDVGGRLAALICQVHNTFGERHSYVMRVAGDVARQECGKTFYVSPFLHMDMTYEFRVASPDDHVSVGIVGRSSTGAPIISAVLSGERQALTDRALLRIAASMPAIGLKVMAAIHWQALRLYLKGMRVVPRPAQPPRDPSGAL
jgi:DUF1365 family protein